MILYCDNPRCVHAFQDSAYGKNKRVHNKMLKQNLYRCTVCGKENSYKEGIRESK